MGRFFLAFVFVSLLSGCSGSPQPLLELDPPEFAEPYVSLEQLTQASPLTGPMARGRAGDWLLENERFQVCVSGTARPGARSGSAGTILDLAPLGVEDPLHEVFTALGGEPSRRALYTRVERGDSDSLSVALVATGIDSHDSTLLVTTRYRLYLNSPALHIETMVVNGGAQTVADYDVGDVLGWGRAAPFAPEYGSSLKGGIPRIPWLGASAGGAAMIYVSEGYVGGDHQQGRSRTVVKTEILAPGDTLRFERYLVVAQGGVSDVSNLRAAHSETGALDLEVHDGQRRPLPQVPFSILNLQGKPVLRGVTDTHGRSRVLVAGGTYSVRVDHPQRGQMAKRVSVRTGQSKEVRFSLPQPATVVLASQLNGSPVPSTWIFEGIQGTPDPVLGSTYDFPVAGPVAFSPGGSVRVDLPQGRYRVTCMHDVFHEAWQTEVQLDAGRTEPLTAALERLPFSEAWESADPDIHTLDTWNSHVDVESRLLALGCMGIQWFASPQELSSNRVQQAVQPLPASHRPRTLGTAFPGVAAPDHPGAAFVSLWPGPTPRGSNPHWKAWEAQLKRGHTPVAVGTPSAYGLRAGFPRTLVHTGSSGSREQCLNALQAGRVQVTNGPLIDFELEGAQIGETVESDGNAFSGRLRVVAAAWVDVARVEIWVNGLLHSEYRVRETRRPVRFDEEVFLRVPGGRSFIQVRVKGERAQDPLLPQEGTVTAFAYTNPIWVEVPFAQNQPARTNRTGLVPGTAR